MLIRCYTDFLESCLIMANILSSYGATKVREGTYLIGLGI